MPRSLGGEGTALIVPAAYRCDTDADVSSGVQSSVPVDAREAVGAPLLTVGDVALYLSLHERTVRRLVDRGELPPIRFGRAVRFQMTDVERLIDVRREVLAQKRRAPSTRPKRTTIGPFVARLRSLEDERRAG